MATLRARIITGAAAAALALLGVSSTASAAPCAATFGGAFTGSYTCNNLGTPTNVSGPLGGITFLDNDTLLIGGSANAPGGSINQISVVRDGNGHITGFAAAATPYATAPNIDGGLTVGPGGVLFYTAYPSNQIGQIKPGSTAPDKVINLGSLSPSVSASVGTLTFVPAGFGGAGGLKIANYSSSIWYSATLTGDGNGTFDVTIGASIALAGGGPEGIVYVDGGNAGFAGQDSVLISEYGGNTVSAYEIDANGDPIVGTRQTFLSGISGAEGAVSDPLTGDFLFSTFRSGNEIWVISGFTAPIVSTPEPMSLVLLGGAAVGIGLARRRRTT